MYCYIANTISRSSFQIHFEPYRAQRKFVKFWDTKDQFLNDKNESNIQVAVLTTPKTMYTSLSIQTERLYSLRLKGLNSSQNLFQSSLQESLHRNLDRVELRAYQRDFIHQLSRTRHFKKDVQKLEQFQKSPVYVQKLYLEKRH